MVWRNIQSRQPFPETMSSYVHDNRLVQQDSQRNILPERMQERALKDTDLHYIGDIIKYKEMWVKIKISSSVEELA